MLSRTLSRKAYIVLFTTLTLFLSCGGGSSPDNNTSEIQPLEVISPEEAGWSSEALAAVEEIVIQNGYAAVMALYDG
jgi:hypothetical protein